MSDKPSYLGLLNAIVVGERRGHAVLTAWQAVTRDAELAEVLSEVAIREREHAAAFNKRLCELGYEVKETPSAEFEESMATARSVAGDAEKFRRVLGYGATDATAGPDPLARIFEDLTIDPRTGGLLGRFIAEERDSERRLRAVWKRLEPGESPAGPSKDPVLEDITTRIDRLAQTIQELKQLRSQ